VKNRRDLPRQVQISVKSFRGCREIEVRLG